MSWYDGEDKATGDLVSSSDWNKYLGASGSIQYLYDAWHWLSSPSRALTDSDRTSSQSWVDLDLTAYTSANARWVLLLLTTHIDSIGAPGVDTFGVRKNGDTPTYYPFITVINGSDGSQAGRTLFVLMEMGAGQIIEWQSSISGTIQVDHYIDVLGYME